MDKETLDTLVPILMDGTIIGGTVGFAFGTIGAYLSRNNTLDQNIRSSRNITLISDAFEVIFQDEKSKSNPFSDDIGLFVGMVAGYGLTTAIYRKYEKSEKEKSDSDNN